jgi:hypothetical protein
MEDGFDFLSRRRRNGVARPGLDLDLDLASLSSPAVVLEVNP